MPFNGGLLPLLSSSESESNWVTRFSELLSTGILLSTLVVTVVLPEASIVVTVSIILAVSSSSSQFTSLDNVTNSFRGSLECFLMVFTLAPLTATGILVTSLSLSSLNNKSMSFSFSIVFLALATATVQAIVVIACRSLWGLQSDDLQIYAMGYVIILSARNYYIFLGKKIVTFLMQEVTQRGIWKISPHAHIMLKDPNIQHQTNTFPFLPVMEQSSLSVAPSGIKGWSTVFLPGDTSGTTVTLWEKYCKLRVSVRPAHKPGCHLLS
nr:unnamed protein product [Callosobruchus analis]